MARGRWIKLARVTGVMFVVGTLAAAGFRYGWWSTLIAGAPAAPWDWIERLSWIASLASLPLSLASLAGARRSSTDLPRPRRRKLTAVAEIQPREIGIHPAARPQNSLEEPLTPYVTRDVDSALRSELDRACAQGGLITMVGDSATGKSRSLYEALRTAKLPGWRVLVPCDVEEVKAAVLPARTVVLLDDTPSPRFLAQGGLTAADVAALIGNRRGPIVVICVLWPSAYDAITARPADRGKVPVDPWRDARDVLRLADGSPVMIPHTFSAQERDLAAAGAAATGDHRLHAALADHRFGVTQNIAGVPQLADHWTSAAIKHPTGAALLTAAIDIRRLGIRQPLTRTLLRAVFPAYLRALDRDEAPRQSFRDAFDYARRELAGHLRALNRVSGRWVGNAAGYELHDYLQQAGMLDRRRAPVPPVVLDILAARITGMDELTRLALSVDQLGVAPHAKALLQRVYRHDQTARWRLVQLLVDERDEVQLRSYLAEGVSEARVGLVEVLADQHRFDEVVVHWGHPDVEDAQWWGLGEELFWRGHEELFRRLDAAGDENGHQLYLMVLEKNGREEELAALAPPADPNGDGWAQTFLARLYVRQGRFEEALEEYGDLMHREDGDFADEATRAWAALMVTQDREDALRDWVAEDPDDELPLMFLADLLAKQQRLDELRELATGHAFTVEHRYTALLRRMGRVDELRELAASGDWWTAEDDLAALLEDLQAEDDLRRLDAAGSRPGHAHLISLLATLGRTEELRSRALSGDEKARKLIETSTLAAGDTARRPADAIL